MIPAQKSFDARMFIATSILLDVALGDHGLPLVEFGFQERGAVLRTGAARLDSDLSQRRFDLIPLQCLADLVVETREHIRRNARGSTPSQRSTSNPLSPASSTVGRSG